jgi:hypothetical protein
LRPNETALTAQEVRARLAGHRGNHVMHHDTLNRAIRHHGLPARPNPFGRGYLFYWSEVEAWLASAPVPQSAPPVLRRGPGRPRKNP